MKRTDKLVSNRYRAANDAQFRAVAFYASFDITSATSPRSKEKGDECHLGFARLDGVHVVKLMELVNGSTYIGGSTLRDVEEVLTLVSAHPHLYVDVFDGILRQSLRNYGLTPDAYRQLVGRCWSLLNRIDGGRVLAGPDGATLRVQVGGYRYVYGAVRHADGRLEAARLHETLVLRACGWVLDGTTHAAPTTP